MSWAATGCGRVVRVAFCVQLAAELRGGFFRVVATRPLLAAMLGLQHITLLSWTSATRWAFCAVLSLLAQHAHTPLRHGTFTPGSAAANGGSDGGAELVTPCARGTTGPSRSMQRRRARALRAPLHKACVYLILLPNGREFLAAGGCWLRLRDFAKPAERVWDPG